MRALAMRRMLAEPKSLVNVAKGIYTHGQANPVVRRKRNVTERHQTEKYCMDFQPLSPKLVRQEADRSQTGTRVWTACISCVINLNLDPD